MNPSDLLTITEIAERAGVTWFTARTWTHRYKAFPVPWKVGRVGESHLYLTIDVDEWLKLTGRKVPAKVL